MKLRKASAEEVEALNEFIRISKAVWGYTDKFLDQYMKHWGITKESLEKKSVKVLEVNGEIHGVFRLGKNKKNIELDLFFVNPKYIKTGVGRKMWNFIDEYARANKWKGFELMADPNAELFFQRMGAETVRTIELFPGAVTSVMKYELTPTER